MMTKKIIFIELNEINFDLIKRYIDIGKKLPAFSKLINSNDLKITESEHEYENVEPWIQWVSIRTGKAFSEHRVFHLGDITEFEGSQIYEELEGRGYTVAAMAPMNAVNRTKNPKFFIPDPWTDTKSSDDLKSRLLHRALRQAVNENASGRLTIGSVLGLLFVAATSLSLRQLIDLVRRVPWALRRPKWRKAIFLDVFLSKIFRSFLLSRRPDFSTVFFNAGAHVQHHYLNSSTVLAEKGYDNPKWYCGDEDPIFEAYQAYDTILHDLARLEGFQIVIATGLSQIPYRSVDFYYRLANHERFFQELGLKVLAVSPRMTRDFRADFRNVDDRDRFVKFLETAEIRGTPAFGNLTVEENSLFVSFIYPFEITAECVLQASDFGCAVRIHEWVNFVSLKNAHHTGRGFFVSDDSKIQSFLTRDSVNVKDIFGYVLEQYPNRH